MLSTDLALRGQSGHVGVGTITIGMSMYILVKGTNIINHCILGS